MTHVFYENMTFGPYDLNIFIINFRVFKKLHDNFEIVL
jgi:hypothetical protein